MLNLSRDDVSRVRRLSENLLVAVSREASDIDVDDLASLGVVHRLSVIVERVLLSEMRREEALLLLGSSLVGGRHLFALLQFVVIDSSVDRATAVAMTVKGGTLLSILHFGAVAGQLLLALSLHISRVQPVG